MSDIELPTPNAGSWMDSGAWAAFSLGEFLRLLVDGGPNDVVMMRVVKNYPPDENGGFVMAAEIQLVPNGQVKTHARAIGCVKFHNDLITLIERGLVK